jgi:RNA binding activity-knot of a chromodomain
MANDTPNGTRPSTPHNGTATPNPAVATIHNLRVGCKAYAHKDGELRQAEILSIQIKQNEPHFYVHYKEYNKVWWELTSLIQPSASMNGSLLPSSI